MATTTTGTRTTGSDLVSGIKAQWQQASKALQDRQRRRARYLTTLRELRALGPRELADIGIASHDIERIAREDSRRV